MLKFLRAVFSRIRYFFRGSSPQLSEVEIRDIEESEREFREGKTKTFNSAEELIVDLHKQRGWHKIAEKNRQRQRDMLGYGLKSRNFRPRPAFEKHLWDLQKKPEEDD